MQMKKEFSTAIFGAIIESVFGFVVNAVMSMTAIFGSISVFENPMIPMTQAATAFIVAFFFYRIQSKELRWSPVFMGLFFVIIWLLTVPPSGAVGIPMIVRYVLFLFLPSCVGGYIGLRVSKK
jgi:hypothetical protein